MSAPASSVGPGRADRFVSQVGDYVMRLPAATIAGEQLKALRLARGITQEQLALRLGVKQTHVSRIEARDDLKLSTVLDYLRAMDAGELELHVSFADGARIALPLPKGP